MANEQIGRITCPHCGNQDATVHREKKQGRLYYRCYESPGSVSMRCGTVQIRGPQGQRWIEQHMRPIASEAANSAPEPMQQRAIASDAPESAEQKPKRGALDGFLANFWSDNDE